MKAHERNALALIASLVEPHGFVAEARAGGKHLAVHVEHPDGRRGKFPVSCSPRDADAQLNQIRQQMMHWLESVGVDTGRGEPGAVRRSYRRRRVRSTIHRFEVAIDPQTGPARDPWAVLAKVKA